MHKVPIKPLSINEAFKGRRFKTSKCKEYEKDVGFLLPRKLDLYPKMELKVNWGFKTAASDVDNPAKIFIDVLQGKYRFNDNNLWRLVLEKEIASGDPYILFEINKFTKKLI